MARPYYLLQSAFTSGEISPEVANRVELDKYQYALVKAKNCYIRPYGPVYKRGGMKYCGAAKNAAKKAILVPFSFSSTIDYLLEIGEKYIRVWRNGAYLNVELATPYTATDLNGLRFTQSADVMIVTHLNYAPRRIIRYSETSWSFSEYPIHKPYFDDSLVTSIETSDSISITPSDTSGSVVLTASANIFTSNLVGGYIRLRQDVPNATAKIKLTTATSQTSSTLLAGEDWKIISGGTWTGQITVQRYINGTWVEYRKYDSEDNFNVTETGSFKQDTQIRMIVNITKGSCNATLTAMPYTKEGYGKITAVTSATECTVQVVEAFGATTATEDYAHSAWSNEFGYPKCACFFQDRLVFAASKKQQYAVWMSRTGDYGNFSVEKASGTVTDDSAIAASFISRKFYEIQHLVAYTDLLVLTSGNEWLVSGSEVVTPTNLTPRMQSTRGCNDCEPLIVGGRIVFVQNRGSMVRDMGYTYETDSYAGSELTLLAEHMLNGIDIVDVCYKQEPDSMVYAVRSDGTLMCMAYIPEQNVYGWSTIETQGKVEAVANIAEGDQDVVYAIVLRDGKRYMECFTNDLRGELADDYTMLDCCKVFDLTTATNTFSVPHLAGVTVDVLADGRWQRDIKVASDGAITLRSKFKHVVVGLRYDMVITMPNVEIPAGDGTMQGRLKQCSNVIIRFTRSLGGRVGADENVTDEVKFDELSTTGDVKLYSGDKRAVVPIGGYNYEGRVCYINDEPYPCSIAAIVREVTFGG